MSVLEDVEEVLKNSSELAIVGIDNRHVHGRFNTHVFRVAPALPQNESGMLDLFTRLRRAIPKAAFRASDILGRDYLYGVLTYMESIGKEKVIRTFTVDDASTVAGEQFKQGLQHPVESDLFRAIEIELFRTAEEAHQHRSGRTIYMEPTGVAA